MQPCNPIGRRSPNDLHAFEVLVDLVLDRLDKGKVADPAAYHSESATTRNRRRGTTESS